MRLEDFVTKVAAFEDKDGQLYKTLEEAEDNQFVKLIAQSGPGFSSLEYISVVKWIRSNPELVQMILGDPDPKLHFNKKSRELTIPIKVVVPEGAKQVTVDENGTATGHAYDSLIAGEDKFWSSIGDFEPLPVVNWKTIRIKLPKKP